MSNQDLINQIEDYKVKVAALIADKESNIVDNTAQIQNYTSSIIYLENLIDTYEADIVELNQQIANFDLIEGYIPPDISKK